MIAKSFQGKIKFTKVHSLHFDAYCFEVALHAIKRKRSINNYYKFPIKNYLRKNRFLLMKIYLFALIGHDLNL